MKISKLTDKVEERTLSFLHSFFGNRDVYFNILNNILYAIFVEFQWEYSVIN